MEIRWLCGDVSHLDCNDESRGECRWVRVVGSQCACGQARGYKGPNCNQTKRPTHLTQQGESKCVCGEISNLYFCTSSDICSPGSFSRLQSPILWVYSIIDKVYKLAGKLQIVNCLLSSLRPRNHPAHGGLWWCFCCKSVFGIVCAFFEPCSMLPGSFLSFE